MQNQMKSLQYLCNWISACIEANYIKIWWNNDIKITPVGITYIKVFKLEFELNPNKKYIFIKKKMKNEINTVFIILIWNKEILSW